MTVTTSTPKPLPRIAITYCSMCNWLLRSAWMAQELLQTFGQDLGEVVLIPRTGGIFQIHYDGELIWDRTVDGGFPDVKQLKQRVRDRLDPARDSAVSTSVIRLVSSGVAARSSTAWASAGEAVRPPTAKTTTAASRLA